MKKQRVKVKIKFRNTGWFYHERICKRFGWTIKELSLNGEITDYVKEEDIPDLKKTQEMGFIGILKWN